MNKAERIQEMLSKMQAIRDNTSTSWSVLCRRLNLPYASVMRWRYRARDGSPVMIIPGPKKVEPLPIASLMDDLVSLSHGTKRSAGSGALYQAYAPCLSRRDLSGLVAMARQDINQEHRENLRRITWQAPGIAWSADDTEYGTDLAGHTRYLHMMKDLASQYKFPPLAGEMAGGEEIAGNLRHHFDKFGAPLCFKRDLGSNLQHQAVNEVLSDYLVIPLNSPPQYPPYNGSIEHSQGEIKSCLRQKLAYRTWPENHLEAWAESAVHDLNHRSRPILRGKNACQVFFSEKTKHLFTKPERRNIFNWIQQQSLDILIRMNGMEKAFAETAFRIAVETWLRWKGYITVSMNGKVLPNLDFNLAQN